MNEHLEISLLQFRQRLSLCFIAKADARKPLITPRLSTKKLLDVVLGWYHFGSNKAVEIGI